MFNILTNHYSIFLSRSIRSHLSERDEEILANEVEPIYGWRLKRD